MRGAITINYSSSHSATYEKDTSQIALISNQKTLVAAYDSLGLADIGKDKSPSGIHSKYSRIKICVIDFSKKPSIYLNFFLKPAEIRRIYWQSRIVKGGKEYKIYWAKKKEKQGKIIAETMTISHEPWVDDDKSIASNYPWKIYIATGEYKNGPASPTYDKKCFKRLSDDEFGDFFSIIVSYLNAWETIIGAPLIKALQEKKSRRFVEVDETLDDVNIEEN